MLCDDCKYNNDGSVFIDEHCNNLRRVESVPDKNGFVIIALKCSGYKKKV